MENVSIHPFGLRGNALAWKGVISFQQQGDRLELTWLLQLEPDVFMSKGPSNVNTWWASRKQSERLGGARITEHACQDSPSSAVGSHTGLLHSPVLFRSRRNP